ncbi:MAG: non-ribosomal peptide synthetase [Gammaproteobacteria bacterium]
MDSAKDDRAVDFDDLRGRGLGVLRHLQAAGLGPGDELILFCNDNEQFIDAFWACLLGGIVPVPVAVGISDDHRQKLVNIFGALQRPHLYTARGLARRLEEFGADHGLADTVSAMLGKTVFVDDIEDIGSPGEPHAAQPDDTAFIQFSSGSTSAPKGVVLTHRNVLTNIDGIIQGGGFTDADRSLSWMPLTHDMGLIGFHLNMLAANVEHAIMDTSLFVRRPLLWLEKASELRATVLCSPNFGYKHALKVYESKGLEGVDLSAVRLIFNGAEPISVELAGRFMQAMARHGLRPDAMFCVYGLAEASLAVTFPAPGAPLASVTAHRHGLNVGEPFREAAATDPDAITFARVGGPIPHCEVRIADDDDAPLGERAVGHVQIRGGNVTGGYYGGAAANAATFADGGWLRTGDLGFFVDGELVITGRSKDIIFVNGQNYYPHDLEEIAHQLDGLELGKVAVAGTTGPESGDDRILVFVLHRGDLAALEELARALRGHVNAQTGLEVHEVIPVQRIPKTTSGKVQRHKLVEAFLDGDFDGVLGELAALREAQAAAEGPAGSALEREIQVICDDIVVDRAVGLDDNLFEIGISSLALAQIHERIEEQYPDKLDIADLFDHPSIRELAAHLQSKLDGG